MRDATHVARAAPDRAVLCVVSAQWCVRLSSEAGVWCTPGPGQIVLIRDLFKTLFRSARLGRVEGSASDRSAETTTTSDAAGTQPAPVAMFLLRQKYGSSVQIDREELPQHPHSVASTVGAPSCCGCWTRDWRAPSLPQVGIITVLNCVMAGAPASASRTPL